MEKSSIYLISRARRIIKDQKKIHDHISSGKNIADLKDYGINFAQPLNIVKNRKFTFEDLYGAID